MAVQGRILGLDVGNVRIGVALSDPAGVIASPHCVIQARSFRADADAVRDLVNKTESVLIVAGIPLNLEGQPGAQAHHVLKFVEILKSVVDVDVVTQDERYSTAASKRLLIEAKVQRKKRKRVIDKVAAAYILQAYLDREARLQGGSA